MRGLCPRSRGLKLRRAKNKFGWHNERFGWDSFHWLL